MTGIAVCAHPATAAVKELLFDYLVIFLTRYGERSAKDWMLADYYRYRVALPGL